MDDKSAPAPPAPEPVPAPPVPQAGTRKIVIRPGIALPGSVVVIGDKPYVVDAEMSVTLPPTVTEDEIKDAKVS